MYLFLGGTGEYDAFTRGILARKETDMPLYVGLLFVFGVITDSRTTIASLT